MSSFDTYNLITAIYAATLSPQDFNKVFDSLEEALFAGEGDLAVGETGSAGAGLLVEGDIQLPAGSEILRHIELVRSIQERVGRQKTHERRIAAILESVPNPAFLVDDAERLVGRNQLAEAKFCPQSGTLADILPDAAARKRIRDFLTGRSKMGLLATAGFLDLERNAQTSFLVRRVDPALLGGSESVFLVTVVDFGFSQHTEDLFRDAYDLTNAESRVAVLLASGLSLSDIAEQRRATVETVRTQIKSIRSKTGARDMPALVRLLCGFSAGLLAPAGDQAAMPANPHDGTLRSRRHITLRDGRRLEYLEQGAANGSPVLLFHNVPYGADLPAAAVSQANRDNLRFIAPYRPGSGDSDLVESAPDGSVLSQVANDMAELMARLGIARAVVVSHSVGAAYALRFARLFPNRVSALVAVGRAPIWRDEWVKQTPQRQRFVQRLAMRFPQLLPVVSWAMISCLERGFAREFVTYACKDGKADSEALANSETLDLMVQGSTDGMRHGTESFCRDCVLAVTDFTEEAKVTPHKFHILHGSDDRIVSIEQSMAFVREVPGSTLEPVEGAGQLLFYSHWPRVLDTVKAKLNKA